jgi:hypothetical protein
MTRLFLGVAVIVAGLSGCASPAHYVEKRADGGVVAVPDGTNNWPNRYKDAATELIIKHVGSNYEIVDETNVQLPAKPESPFGPAQPSAQSVPQGKTELRITYRKKAVPPGTPINGIGTNTMPAGAGLGAGTTRQTGGMMQNGGALGGGAMGGSNGIVPSVAPTNMTNYQTGGYPAGGPAPGNYTGGGAPTGYNLSNPAMPNQFGR